MREAFAVKKDFDFGVILLGAAIGFVVFLVSTVISAVVCCRLDNATNADTLAFLISIAIGSLACGFCCISASRPLPHAALSGVILTLVSVMLALLPGEGSAWSYLCLPFTLLIPPATTLMFRRSTSATGKIKRLRRGGHTVARAAKPHR